MYRMLVQTKKERERDRKDGRKGGKERGNQERGRRLKKKEEHLPEEWEEGEGGWFSVVDCGQLFHNTYVCASQFPMTVMDHFRIKKVVTVKTTKKEMFFPIRSLKALDQISAGFQRGSAPSTHLSFACRSNPTTFRTTCWQKP